MSTPHPTDRVMAAHYTQVRDALKARARAAEVLYDAAYNGEGCTEEEFGTFAVAVRSALLTCYMKLEEELTSLAVNAQGMVLDYEAHADGTYVSLRPDVLL